MTRQLLCVYTSLTGERSAYEVCHQPLPHECPVPIRVRAAAVPETWPDGPSDPLPAWAQPHARTCQCDRCRADVRDGYGP